MCMEVASLGFSWMAFCEIKTKKKSSQSKNVSVSLHSSDLNHLTSRCSLMRNEFPIFALTPWQSPISLRQMAYHCVGASHQQHVIPRLTESDSSAWLTSYFVYGKVGVVSFQSLLCKLKGLEGQLRLALGVGIWEEGQFTGCPGQPPQELCFIAA